MHIEVQVALNFVISYLYNKLPRRRVNIFGEELEKALKDKFQGHWYPEIPFKGSAYRCLKTGDPVDAVLDRAARESGVPIQDILENLPGELAVWVDPGEVSYRIGEKGAVKILFSEAADLHDDNSADREVTKTFNPEAQCFRPIEAVSTSLSSMTLGSCVNKSSSPFSSLQLSSLNTHPVSSAISSTSAHSSTSSPTPTSFKNSPSPVPTFIPRSTAPLTFTTATFAQTKFGSTKLKTSSKRANRMSPTEFSNYIKQRAIQQQIHHHQHGVAPSLASPSGRALSPNGVGPNHQSGDFYFAQGPTHGHGHNSGHGQYHPQFPHRNLLDNQQYIPDVYKLSGWEHLHHPVPPPPASHAVHSSQSQQPTAGSSGPSGQDNTKQPLLDGLNNYGLSNQYQHLLVAN